MATTPSKMKMRALLDILEAFFAMIQQVLDFDADKKDGKTNMGCA
jgi:hypothetical protein